MLNDKLEEIKKLQAEIDHRTAVEDEAIRLISECQFEKAMKLLDAI